MAKLTKVNKKISNIPNPNIEGDKMAKLIISEETNEVTDINQEIMLVVLKVLSIYKNNDKTCYFSKWKPYFFKTFPSLVTNTKSGKWIMNLSSPTRFAKDADGNQYIEMEGAIAFLVRSGFVTETDKEFKNGFTGKLYTINASSAGKVNKILNNFVREFDDQLYTEIEELYNEKEKSQQSNYKSGTSSFSAMGFTS